MTKSKDHTNLYEILKGPLGDKVIKPKTEVPAEQHPPVAQKAEVAIVVEDKVEPSRKEVERVQDNVVKQPISQVSTVQSMPTAVPTIPTVQKSPVDSSQYSRAIPGSPADIGENILKISYNTAIFLLIIFIGLLIMAYALGVRHGKGKIGSPIQVSRTAGTHTIKVTQARTRQDAENVVNKLRNVGFNTWNDGLTVYCGEFNDPNSGSAVSTINKIKQYYSNAQFVPIGR